MLEDQTRDMTVAAPGFEQARALAEEEAFCLDSALWDRWIDLFTEDCEIWVPTFVSEDEIANDPLTQVSHIYYDRQSALRDRIYRLTSGESAASSPRPRTLHHQSGFRLVDDPPEGRTRIRCAWTTHVYSPHIRHQHVLFGEQVYDVVQIAGRTRIARKYVKILNDFIPTLIDLYFL